jgi:hypothetical protein
MTRVSSPCCVACRLEIRLKPTQPHPTTDLKERRRRLNERLRAEFIAGAKEEYRKRTGRPMTAEELERVLRRYPGDV